MADPAETPLSLNGALDSYIGQHNFVVYTHGSRTRSIVAALFISYLVFFAMFTQSIAAHFQELDSMPPVFAQLEAAEGYPVLGYLVAGVGLLIAVSFLFYFMWAVLDIWGLQVCLSPVELRIQNTITGFAMPRIMGVGSLCMQDIEELRGTRFFTFISGKGKTIRFSPVENVDNLIAGILSHAPDAKVVE